MCCLSLVLDSYLITPGSHTGGCVAVRRRLHFSKTELLHEYCSLGNIARPVRIVTMLGWRGLLCMNSTIRYEEKTYFQISKIS